MILSRALAAVTLLAAVLCAPSAWSDEPIALAPEEGLLLLKNGEVIQGKISQSGNRYYVTLPSGELRLRAEDVSLRCKDLADGYARQRQALTNARPEEHLDLAQWCLNHQLFPEAETEIRYAAQIDADHPRIRLLWRRLELARATPEPTPVVVTPTPANDEADLDQMARQVPTAVMQQFATSIQPLLVNSCATSGCHGVGAKSTFTLAKIRGQGNRARRQTQRNLLAVFGQIDRHRPMESPVLVAPIEPHGGTKAIFTRQNSRQYYELFEWVRLAAGDRRSPAALVQGEASEPSEREQGVSVETDEAVEPAGFEADTDQTETDPFDPAGFNAEFGGDE